MGNKVHSLIYYWWDRIFSVPLFLFWIHVTFQYLGICRSKTVQVVLIFDEFQCSDFFLSFYGRMISRSRLTSAICLCRWLFPNSVLLFLRATFPGVGWDQRVSPTDFCPKLKILFQISLTENGILAPRVCGLIIQLFVLPLIPSAHDARVTWIPFFVQQATGHRVRVVDLLSYTILTVSLSACWFKYRRVRELTSPSFSL